MGVPNSLFRDGGNRFGSILYSTQPENGEYIIGVPHVRSITSHFDGKSQSNEPENVSLNRKPTHGRQLIRRRQTKQELWKICFTSS